MGTAGRQRGFEFSNRQLLVVILQWSPSECPIPPDELPAWETMQGLFPGDDLPIHAEEDDLKLYRLPNLSVPDSVCRRNRVWYHG